MRRHQGPWARRRPRAWRRARAMYPHTPARGLAPRPALPFRYALRPCLDHNAIARFRWVAERMQNHAYGLLPPAFVPALSRSFCQDHFFVTGPELRQLRNDLGDAIGRPLSAAEMAKLCG